MTRRKHAKQRQQFDQQAEKLADVEYQRSQPPSAIGVAIAESVLQAGSGDGFLRKLMARQ